MGCGWLVGGWVVGMVAHGKVMGGVACGVARGKLVSGMRWGSGRRRWPRVVGRGWQAG